MQNVPKDVKLVLLLPEGRADVYRLDNDTRAIEAPLSEYWLYSVLALERAEGEHVYLHQTKWRCFISNHLLIIMRKKKDISFGCPTYLTTPPPPSPVCTES